MSRIQATLFGGSFAAIKHDHSVVTWGIPRSGGDSEEVQDQLYAIIAHLGSRL